MLLPASKIYYDHYYYNCFTSIEFQRKKRTLSLPIQSPRSPSNSFFLYPYLLVTNVPHSNKHQIPLYSQEAETAASSSSPEFLDFNDNETNSHAAATFITNKVKTDDSDDDNLILEELKSSDGDDASLSPRRRKRQTIYRSSILAKQVITIQSAISLGFVSQLWVDTTSWLVLVIELRPNLLSAQLERLLLQDIHQVGDVVLVQDESVIENEICMAGLDTLVGYNVVTPGKQYMGKVRGYNFNVNSGAVESLELDSFGLSVIPSSLVSTYALLVEDVLEVVLDTVIVREAASSQIQRLTRGFWDARKAMESMDQSCECTDLENHDQPDYRWRNQGKSPSETYLNVGDMDTDWELPMDYL